MEYEEVLTRLKAVASPEWAAGMRHFGIETRDALGISVPDLRRLARKIGRDHALAQQLWWSRIHEARKLAALIDDPQQVSEEQMERWVRDIDSWDVCDACCGDLFDKTPFAFRKAAEWSTRPEEFVKRAGFALMAYLAVHDKKAGDDAFLPFLPLIKREATDGRNFVKKAVNWALRQIGKRNRNLNGMAIATAWEIRAIDSPAARWVASDALRELTSPKSESRLRR